MFAWIHATTRGPSGLGVLRPAGPQVGEAAARAVG